MQQVVAQYTFRRPWWQLTLVIVSLGLALLAGYCGGIELFNGAHIDPVSCWELIALGGTVILSFVYFADLRRQVLADGIHMEWTTMNLHSAWLTNVVFLLAAALIMALVLPTLPMILKHETIVDVLNKFALKPDSLLDKLDHIIFLVYLGCVTVSFIIFARLDYKFAGLARNPRKVKEYSNLFIFVDFPTVVAFIVLWLYIAVVVVAANRDFNINLFSGAVVMQMLMQNALFLVVTSNYPEWRVAKFLRQSRSRPAQKPSWSDDSRSE